ncbi:MAG TPA: YegS/Rv2252/BmrU family lipid kinase, partial [Bacillales bacterium]|nr:YegS/Rv2252/BmrU family lipid kinase [Bacillales bacterium]
MYAFIINAQSGHGKGRRIWEKVRKKADRLGLEYEFYLTNQKADVAKAFEALARNQELKAVIAVGGDGTVQGMLSHVMDLDLPLGVIPAGSGNDFARALAVPPSPEQALDYVLNGTVSDMDLIQIDERYGLTIAGTGLDAEVAFHFDHSWYKQTLSAVKLGTLGYLFSLLAVFLKFQPVSLSLTIDGKTYDYKNVWMAAVGNTPYYGGGMKVCPAAKPDDGMLEICLIHGGTPLKLLFGILPRIF